MEKRPRHGKASCGAVFAKTFLALKGDSGIIASLGKMQYDDCVLTRFFLPRGAY